MSERIVRFPFDPYNPPPLSEAEKAEIAALKADPIKEEDIDFSDIPPLDEKFWKNAKPNRFFRPVKQQITLRLDADLIAWFKREAEGDRGYQTKINRALRLFIRREERLRREEAAELQTKEAAE